MFDGIPDQFHQFMPSRTSLPLPLCTFPSAATTFDPYTSSTHPHHQAIQPTNDLFMHHHPLHHHPSLTPPPQITKSKVEAEKDQGGNGLHSFDLGLERARSIPEPIDLWSNDEVFALLKIRSSMDSSWFPQDFTWEQVSRRLEELGFKRSADKCKEKFEEESRAYFSNINSYKQNSNHTNNYRHFSELEVICHGDETQTAPPLIESLSGEEKTQSMGKPSEDEDEEVEEQMDQVMEEGSEKGAVMETAQENEDSLVDHREEELKRKKKDNKNKKKEKQRKFEVLKGYCEGFVKKMMSKQEELHNKLLEDMKKRDEEKFAMEEARKKQELERIDKEIENWEHEQAISNERQASIIEFLDKFTFGSHQNQIFGGKKSMEQLLGLLSKTPTSQMATTTTSLRDQPNPNPCTNQNNSIDVLSSSPETLAPQTPTSATKLQTSSSGSARNNVYLDEKNSSQRTSNSAKRRSSHDRSVVSIIATDDYGKRWPRDEVLALINVRCSFFNEEDNNPQEGGGGGGGTTGTNNNSNKVPLWERISQKMTEMGYKRSAKRCKEKWENINKYFRKTKDTNRKRSVESRTCPYFQQLSSLYNNNQGGDKVMTLPENSSSSPENHSSPPENGLQEHSQTMHERAVEEGDKDTHLGQPSFEFDY